MDTQTEQSYTVAAPQGSAAPPPLRRKRPNRARRIVKTLIATFCVLAAVGGLVFFSWRVFFAPEPVFYRTAYVTEVERLASSPIYGNGYLNPSVSEDIYPEINGTILENLVDLRSRVEKGDILYQISPEGLDEDIQEQRDAIALLERDIEEIEKDIAEVEAQLAEANAEQINMQKASMIYAPFSGTITEVGDFVIGQTIMRGTPIGRLVDDAKMKLTLYFSYGYESDIYINQPCEVSIPSAMAVVPGKVTGIEKVRRVDADGTVSFEVEVSLDNPGALTRGVPATASMKSASGDSILPVAAGELHYNREEMIIMESQGPLKNLHARNYYPFQQGDLLLSIDFEPDNSVAEGYLLTIQTHRDSIDSKMEQIAQRMTAIAELELNYEKLTVRAPISGIVAQFNAYAGMAADVNALVRVSQSETLTLAAFVDERYIRALSLGMVLDVYVSGMMGEYTVPGEITAIDTLTPNMDYGYARYPLSISIDNSDGSIIDGQYGSFNYTAQVVENALCVPIQAVQNTYMGPCIFIEESKKQDVAKEQAAAAIDLEDDSVPPGFHAIPVKTGLTQGRLIQVIGEVKKGWKVYLSTTTVEPTVSPTPEESEEPEEGEEPAEGDDSIDGLLPEGDLPDKGGDIDTGDISDGDIDTGDFSDGDLPDEGMVMPMPMPEGDGSWELPPEESTEDGDESGEDSEDGGDDAEDSEDSGSTSAGEATEEGFVVDGGAVIIDGGVIIGGGGAVVKPMPPRRVG